MSEPEFPANWRLSDRETTAQGSEFYEAVGTIIGRYSNRTLTILIYRHYDGREWVAKAGRGFPRGDTPTFARGDRETALAAACEEAERQNDRWAEIEGFETVA